jgi:hypothetical protein
MVGSVAWPNPESGRREKEARDATYLFYYPISTAPGSFREQVSTVMMIRLQARLAQAWFPVAGV